MVVRVSKTFPARRKVFFVTLLLVAGIHFSPTLLNAQETAPDRAIEAIGHPLPSTSSMPTSLPPKGEGETEGVHIGEVRVEGRARRVSNEDVSAFATIIRPDATRITTQSISEMISQTVGVDVTSMGGEGQLSTVSIRGSSAEQVAVFLDGVRINTALAGAVDFSTIPIEAIDRIEIIRGDASARFGTDAIGGVINIVTKSAGKTRAIDLALTGASFATLKTQESWREPHEMWDLVLAHSHRSTGGDFTFRSAGVTLAGGQVANPRIYTRLHNRSIMEDVLAKFDVRPTDALTVSVANDFLWTDRQVPGMEIETTQLYPANPLEANEELFRTVSSLKLAIDPLITSGLTGEVGITNLFSHDHFTDPSPALGGPIDTTWVSYAPEGYAKLQHGFSSRHVNLLTTFRYQLRYDHTHDESPLAGANLMGTHGRVTNALFLEEEVGLLGERLVFVPRARVETASSRRSHLSWKVGAIGRPLTWLTIKANVGTSFRYPSFDELYYPDQGYIRGNANLNDEQAFEWDAGIALDHRIAGLECIYFDRRIDNQIMFVPISATTIMPVNTDRARSRGVELTARFDPVKYVHLDANYTFLDATFVANGRRLPGRPRHKANARLEGFIKTLTLFGEVQYIGDYPVNTANTVWLTGHTALNLGARWRFAKHFFATVEVKDVTNVQIYDARGFPLPRRSYWMTVGANYKAVTRDSSG